MYVFSMVRPSEALSAALQAEVKQHSSYEAHCKYSKSKSFAFAGYTFCVKHAAHGQASGAAK